MGRAKITLCTVYVIQGLSQEDARILLNRIDPKVKEEGYLLFYICFNVATDNNWFY